MQIDPAAVSSQIERFIRAQVDNFQREGVVLGLSGGMDSAVVAALAARALGPEQVLALILPERDSSPESKADALLEIQRLGIPYREIAVTPILEALGIYQLVPFQEMGARSDQVYELMRLEYCRQTMSLGETPFQASLLGARRLTPSQKRIAVGNAYARAKHRARMTTLYYAADQENRLVLGTTNKSESLCGFVVKWGDSAADIEPILPLYKTQVRRLAAHLGISEKILFKSPTPDLMPGIDDELALGVDYTTLDMALEALEAGRPTRAVAESLQIAPERVERIQEMVRRSQHLRSLPPAPELDLG